VPLTNAWLGQTGWAILLVLCFASAGEAAVRRVVLLQSLERGNLVLDRFTAMLRTQLAEGSAEPLTFTEFVINPFGFSDASEQEMVDYLRSTFDGRPAPDLVITTGGPAAAFARKFRSELFPDSPMLYGAVDRLFVSGNFSDHETALAVANDPIGVVADILRLFPATENIFVVIGAGPLGRFWRTEFERALGQFRDRVRFIWPDGMSYAALLQRASTLPPHSAIFFSSFDVDADGAAYSTAQVLADLRGRANAPLFGSQSAELGHGPIGGNLISIDTLSNKTADVALQILGGTLPARITIPIQQPGPYVFDWRELQRWGVDEGRLPAGSLIRFREPSVWERSKWLILGGVSVFVAQSVLLTALLVSRVKRRRAELSLRESERRFRVLANSAPVMIRTSGPDALATDFNIPWLQFTGRQLDAERGTGWLEGVHRDDLEAGVDTRRRAFERREPYRLEYRLRRADGEYRWVLESVQPRFTPDGVFAGMIGSAVDITELKAARAALSNLNRRLMEAQEQERSRLARELHDDVCQQLTMLALDLERFSESLPQGATDAREQAHEMYEQVRALGAYVNGLSHRLHSSKLELFGLAAAGESFCKEIASHHGVIVEFAQQNVPATLPEGVALNLFRVLQEALSNAVKHSGAPRHYVSLRGTTDELHLEVMDEGCGFDMTAALRASGLGLISMQERLRLVTGP
jgi:PAS domain S-box-containing protein